MPGIDLNAKLLSDQNLSQITSRISSTYALNSSPIDFVFTKQIPNYILQQLQHASTAFMGIIEEISRLYITIDNRLFLLEIEGSDFYSYEGTEDNITNVFCLTPKSSVFDFDYLLGIVTSSSVQLLGVNLGGASGESSSTDQFSMFLTQVKVKANVPITGADSYNGYIYLIAGPDLYELEYEAEESWFKNTCGLKNHSRSPISYLLPSFLTPSKADLQCIRVDAERKLLYTLASDSEISLYSLSTGAPVLMERNKVFDQLRHVFGLRVSDDLKVLAMHVSCSKEYALIISCSNGYRVFVNNKFQVCHVRSVPVEGGLVTIPPTFFDCSFYSNGIYFASGPSQHSNTFLFSSLDVAALKFKTMSENLSILSLSDRIWDFGQAQLNFFEKHLERIYGVNVLALQVLMPPKRFHVLTNSGIYTILQIRPIDILSKLFAASNGHESDSIKVFLGSYSDDEVCAMCLAIICSNRFCQTDFKNMANIYFYKYGASRSMDANDEYQTARVHGILLYLSRLVGAYWNFYINDFSSDPKTSAIFTHQLNISIENCLALQTFIEHHIQNCQSLERSEKVILSNVYSLIEQIVETFYFLVLLIPFNISDLLNNMKGKSYFNKSMESVMFNDLISSFGHIFLRELGQIFMSRLIESTYNIDGMCESLKGKCSLFFNGDDIKIFKAREIIQKASSCGTEMLEKSLAMLMEAAKSLSIAQLESICIAYNSVGYPEAAVKLALTAAQECDPENSALEVYLNQNKALVSPEPIDNRHECYHIAFDVLDQVIPSDAKETFFKNSSVFKEVLNSKDEYFLYLMYDYLIRRDQLIYILKIDCPHIEQYLERRQYEKSEYGVYLSIYYRSTGKYEKAVGKLYEFATSPKYPADLSKRIDLISLALSIVEGNMVEVDPQFVSELTDLLDVANVQWELSQIHEEFGGDRLFDVSELYAKASKLDLHEAKLAILNVSGKRDDSLLIKIVKEIISTVQVSIPDNESVSQDALRLKIISIGQKYFQNEIVFPLSIIVPLIEEKTLEEGRESWLIPALMEIGYKYREIFSAYDYIFHERIPPFHVQQKLVFILGRIVTIINLWISESKKGGVNFDPKLIGEKVAQYLIFLATSQDKELYENMSTISKYLKSMY